MYEVRVQVDTVEPRPEKGRLAVGFDGTMLSQGFRTDGIWVDPCTLTAMLKPIPLTESWGNTYTGNNARLDPSAAYTIPTPAKWERLQIRASGDYWLRAKQSTNEIVQVTSALPANQPMCIGWYKPELKIGADVPVLRLYYNYSASSTSGEIKIVFYANGKAEIYKAGLLVGSYDRSGSNFAPGSTYTASFSTNQQFNEIVIIPFRRRELLVHTNYGLSFSHIFTDLDESLTTNAITPAGKFAFAVPTGKLAIQVAYCRFSPQGSFIASQQVLRYAPPTTVAGPPVYPLFSYLPFSDTAGPTGDSVQLTTSIVHEGTGDWTTWSVLDNGTTSSWDGIKKTVRVKCYLQNFTGTQSPTVYAVDAFWDPNPTQTYNATTDITNAIGALSISAGEDGRATATISAYSGLLANAGMYQAEYQSDRPYRIQVKTKDAVITTVGPLSTDVIVNSGDPQIPSGGNTYVVGKTVRFDSNAGNIVAGTNYVVATVTGTTSFTITGITPTAYGVVKHQEVYIQSSTVTITGGNAQIPAGGNTYVVGNTVRFSATVGNILATETYTVATVTGTTSFTLTGVLPTVTGSAKHQRVTVSSVASYVTMMAGTLSAPKITRMENDYTDLWSTLDFVGSDRGTDLDLTMIQATPALDGFRLSDAVRSLLRMSGYVDNGSAYDNTSIFISYDGSPTEFTLPLSPGASKGEWAFSIERGETVGGALERLHSTYAATWVKGWIPLSSVLGGYQYAWEVPNKTPSTWDVTIWQTLEQAMDPAKGNLTMPFASTVLLQGLSETRESPEANSVVVVGRDPRRGQIIYGYYQDGPSQDATLAPTSRPTNWRGRPVSYILADPTITSQSKVDYAVTVLQERLTVTRNLVEFDTGLLMWNKGNLEDQYPVWLNDIVRIMGPTGTGVYGWYRIVAIPNIEFVREYSDGSGIQLRSCTYRAEAVTIPA